MSVILQPNYNKTKEKGYNKLESFEENVVYFCRFVQKGT